MALKLLVYACVLFGALSAAVVRLHPLAEAGPGVAPATVVLRHGELSRRLRGDWEPPQALLISYNDIWRDALSEIVRATDGEIPVFVLARQNDSANLESWRGEFPNRVHVLEWPIQSDWVRDYGPIQVADEQGKAIWLDADYRSGRTDDDLIPLRLGRMVAVPVQSLARRLDGGALVSNGTGLCAITRYNLLEANGAEAQPHALMDQLGCEALAILPELTGEPTGHADVFVHFFAPDVVGVASVARQESAENAGRMDVAAAILEQAADSLGIDLRVIRVPMPRRDSSVYYSYLNSVDLRDKVLVPHFDGVAPSIEAAAHAAIRAASNRKIVPIDASEMVTSGGALHCLVLGLFLDRARPLFPKAASRNAG